MNAADQQRFSDAIARLVREHEASSQTRHESMERARIEAQDFLSKARDCIQNVIRPTLTTLSENGQLKASDLVHAATSQTDANGFRLAVTGDTKAGFIAFDPIADRQRIRVRTSIGNKRDGEGATEKDEYIPIEAATESYVATCAVGAIQAILRDEI